ncbi:MAG: hypothetical protein ACRCX2_39025 [Paraclostridium sp.]
MNFKLNITPYGVSYLELENSKSYIMEMTKIYLDDINGRNININLETTVIHLIDALVNDLLNSVVSKNCLYLSFRDYNELVNTVFTVVSNLYKDKDWEVDNKICESELMDTIVKYLNKTIENNTQIEI